MTFAQSVHSRPEQLIHGMFIDCSTSDDLQYRSIGNIKHINLAGIALLGTFVHFLVPFSICIVPFNLTTERRKIL